MPWPVQLLEQTARFSQPYPEKPGAHAQLPLWQRPLPLQLRGQAAGASKEVKCAVSDQAPEEHKPDGSKLPLRAEEAAIGSGMEVELERGAGVGARSPDCGSGVWGGDADGQA